MADLVNLDEARNYLKSPDADDSRVGELVKRASAWVEAYTDRHFIQTAVTESLQGDHKDLFVTRRPIIDVMSVMDLNRGSVLTGYTVFHNEGRLYAPLGWPRVVEVTYTAGYGADVAAVPGPAKQAVLLLVARWYAHPDDLSSERIGDYQYTSQPGIPQQVRELLDPYREVVF